jgi:hypothetical protein
MPACIAEDTYTYPIPKFSFGIAQVTDIATTHTDWLSAFKVQKDCYVLKD